MAAYDELLTQWRDDEIDSVQAVHGLVDIIDGLEAELKSYRDYDKERNGQ